jgi:hypothetical protein
MTEKNDDKQRMPAPTNFAGFNALSNELQHKIITHAVDGPDAWKANKTYSAVRRVNRHLHAAAGSGALQRFKENLDGGRLVSEAVIETAFLDKNFSEPFRWDRRHIGHEVEAVTHALEFQPPEKRSEILNNISSKNPLEKMLGYARIAERLDLFQKHEIDLIEREALATLQDDESLDDLASFRAAEVLAKRYDDIAPEARAALESRQEKFSSAIVYASPSLLRDPGLRSMVRANLSVLDDPHEALSQLASYIDKNSQPEVDFVVEQSLRRFGEDTPTGPQHGLDAQALTIAKLSGATMRTELKDRISELMTSDTEKGRALTSAVEQLADERVAEAPVKLGMRESAKLLRETVGAHNMSDPVAAIERIGTIAKSGERQMNAARRALMDSVCDRNVRGI